MTSGPSHVPVPANHGDWPTHRGDLRRSGVSRELLDVPSLHSVWTWQSDHAPNPAWPGPARWDAYAGLSGLSSMRDYDPVFHPIIVGKRVYLSSTSEDALICLDSEGGEEVWRYPLGAPVRVAPHFDGGRLYLGCDDGAAYCFDETSGSLLWRVVGEPTAGRIWNNGRLISTHPVRTGVCVLNGRAVFGASMLPWNGSCLVSVDAVSGDMGEERTYRTQLGHGITLEGAMAVSNDMLVIPQGRVAPKLFDHGTGKSKGSLAGGGGSFCVVAPEGGVLHGPGNKDGWITDSNSSGGDSVATYSQGTAIVVGEHVAYMLSPGRLGALDRPSQSLLWTVATDCSDAMLIVGDWLVLGGRDRVEARELLTGKLAWESEIRGHVRGLAVGGKRLLAATQLGTVVAFGEGGTRQWIADESGYPIERPELGSPAPQGAMPTRGLLDHFLFQLPTIERRPLSPGNPFSQPWLVNLARENESLLLPGLVDIQQAGQAHCVVLDGKSGDLTIESLSAEKGYGRLPSENLSVEAWVRIDRGQQWGGLIGALQDNGAYERGWVLGFRGLRPGFALKGNSDEGAMTWLTGPEDLVLGGWHHLLGTYDGKTMQLYVDGHPVAFSQSQSGPILYPDKLFYHLGAYRDDNEHFRMRGALHEVAVWEETLTEDQVLRRYQSKARRFPDPIAPVIDVSPASESPATNAPVLRCRKGPIVDFPAQGQARLRASLEQSAPLTWILTDSAGTQRRIQSTADSEHHELIVSDLRPRNLYTYTLESMGAVTPPMECDTHFNFGYAPPRAVASEWPGLAAQESGFARGIAVVLGASEQGPWRSLSDSTDLRVVVVAADEQAALRLRRILSRDGKQGERVSVIDGSTLIQNPLPRGSVNLLLLDESDSANASDWLEGGALHCLRPFGGRVYLRREQALPVADAQQLGLVQQETSLAGMHCYTRPAIPGAGSWTHMYGNPDNSAFGGEQLGGARGVEDLELIWAGRPGPRYQTDRQNRKPSPLAANGRLFLQGYKRIIALDGHNGVPQWNLELPELSRFNIPRSSSNWCADEDSLYLAMGQRIERRGAAKGDWLQSYLATTLDGNGGRHPQGKSEWGFVGSFEDQLVASLTPLGAQHTAWWGSSAWYDGKEGVAAHKICSHQLVALDKDSGQANWSYEGGRILDVTLTGAEGRLWFVTSRAPGLDPELGRLGGDAFWKNLFLVSLDLQSGQVQWERAIEPMAGTVAFYLAYSEGMLVMLSSSAGHSALYALDADNGESRWRKKFAWEADHHGKHLSRPAIVGGRVYSRPAVFDLQTGEPLPITFPEGHQCGSYAATSETLILRAGELCLWDSTQGRASRWTRVRPDCWISTIPGNGMLLSPEGGGGCSCGSWLEASMGFLPKQEGSR